MCRIVYFRIRDINICNTFTALERSCIFLLSENNNDNMGKYINIYGRIHLSNSYCQKRENINLCSEYGNKDNCFNSKDIKIGCVWEVDNIMII
jgi:hypothetical protein